MSVVCLYVYNDCLDRCCCLGLLGHLLITLFCICSDANFTAEEGRSPNAAQAAALLVKSMADGSDWEQPALTGAPTKQATMDSTGQSAFG